MLLNTGHSLVPSPSGLLTTMGYAFDGAKPMYALEGSVAVTGSAVQWLRDQLEIIRTAADVEALAASVPDSGGIYFVPAFSGLFAPYWRTDARGVIAGLSRFHTKAHLARATLEAICFPDTRRARCDGAGLGRAPRRAEGRRRRHRQQPADAAPGRHPRRAGGAAGRLGDHGARRGVCRGPRRRLLEDARFAALELESRSAVGAAVEHGPARDGLRGMEEGGRKSFMSNWSAAFASAAIAQAAREWPADGDHARLQRGRST